MIDFNYDRTIETNKAIYGDAGWNLFFHIRNLGLVAGLIYINIIAIAASIVNDAELFFPILFFMILLAFMLFVTYKQFVSGRLIRLDTGLSKQKNHDFIASFLDSRNGYGLTDDRSEYIIMQQQAPAPMRPDLLVVLMFDGYILINGQNISRYGQRYPPFTGYGVIKAELLFALQQFKATLG